MFRIIKLGNVSARLFLFVWLHNYICVGALLLEQGIDREVSDVPGSVAHFFDASMSINFTSLKTMGNVCKKISNKGKAFLKLKSAL